MRQRLVVQTAAMHIQRMQAALVQMNLQLHLVISDITGVTGLRILRDIIGGRANPEDLAQHRDHRCKASAAEIAAALTGHYRPEHVFVLKQNLELFDTYQRQLEACDQEIEAHLQTLAAQAPEPASPLPARRSNRKPRDDELRFEIRVPLHQLTGTDKLAILVYRALKGDLLYEDPGASAYDAQQRSRVLRRLPQRAANLGFDLLNRETGELFDGGR